MEFSEKFDEDAELYDTKVDVFKRIVNKILLNMTVEIKEIRFRIFESKDSLQSYFSQKTEKKPVPHQISPCFLLKCEFFSIKKRKLEENTAKNLANSGLFIEEIEDFYFDCKGISGHICEDPCEEKADFVDNFLLKNGRNFIYPSISHPNTVFSCSSGFSIHLQRKKLSDEVKKLDFIVENVEITADPEQLLFFGGLAKKISEFYAKKARIMNEFHCEDSGLCEEIPVIFQRNRSFSTNEIAATVEKIQKKSSFKEISEENTVFSLISSVKHEKTKEIPEENDILKGLIKDYFTKTEKKPEISEIKEEFTIEFFEKPQISLNLQKKPLENMEKSTILLREQEKLLINQTEMLLNLTKTEKNGFSLKFEGKIASFTINILKHTRDKDSQDHFARFWLFSTDPLFPKRSENFQQKPNFCGFFKDENFQKKTNFCNFHLPCENFQVIFRGFSLKSRFSENFEVKIEKIKALHMNFDEEIEENKGSSLSCVRELNISI